MGISSKIAVSKEFRKATWRAIAFVGLSGLVYLLLLSVGISLFLLCVYITFNMWAYTFRFGSILVGGALLSIGALMLYFPVKFLFRKREDYSDQELVLSPVDSPALFSMLQELTQEIGTRMPRKVILIADRNASVGYSSGFWSLFLPIRKDLRIGLLLVHSTSVEELKGILAHEFGHFSQRSMRVGSYVHQFSIVLGNMLFDNQGLKKNMEAWGNTSSVISFGMKLSNYIMRGMQWILHKCFVPLHLHERALSREMEKHADEVAVKTVGSEACMTSFLRGDIAHNAFTLVMDFYAYHSVNDSLKTKNLFTQFDFTIKLLAGKEGIPIRNGLPYLMFEEWHKHRMTLLTLPSKWDTHPEKEYRLRAFKEWNITAQQQDDRPAVVLFPRIHTFQEYFTRQYLRSFTYKNQPVFIESEDFEERILANFQKHADPAFFKGYFMWRHPEKPSWDPIIRTTFSPEELKKLFSTDLYDLSRSTMVLSRDIAEMESFDTQMSFVFEYAGETYTNNDVEPLLAKLKQQLDENESRLRKHDVLIFETFFTLANSKGQLNELRQHYDRFFNFEEEWKDLFRSVEEISEAVSFMSVELQIAEILDKIITFIPIEKKFKLCVSELMKHPLIEEISTPEQQQLLDQYLQLKTPYFEKKEYHRSAVSTLFDSIDTISLLLGNTRGYYEKELLSYMAILVDSTNLNERETTNNETVK